MGEIMDEVASALALMEELSVKSSDSGLSEDTCWELFGGPCPEALRKKDRKWSEELVTSTNANKVTVDEDRNDYLLPPSKEEELKSEDLAKQRRSFDNERESEEIRKLKEEIEYLKQHSCKCNGRVTSSLDEGAKKGKPLKEELSKEKEDSEEKLKVNEELGDLSDKLLKEETSSIIKEKNESESKLVKPSREPSLTQEIEQGNVILDKKESSLNKLSKENAKQDIEKKSSKNLNEEIVTKSFNNGLSKQEQEAGNAILGKKESSLNKLSKENGKQEIEKKSIGKNLSEEVVTKLSNNGLSKQEQEADKETLNTNGSSSKKPISKEEDLSKNITEEQVLTVEELDKPNNEESPVSVDKNHQTMNPNQNSIYTNTSKEPLKPPPPRPSGLKDCACADCIERKIQARKTTHHRCHQCLKMKKAPNFAQPRVNVKLLLSNKSSEDPTAMKMKITSFKGDSLAVANKKVQTSTRDMTPVAGANGVVNPYLLSLVPNAPFLNPAVQKCSCCKHHPISKKRDYSSSDGYSSVTPEDPRTSLTKTLLKRSTVQDKVQKFEQKNRRRNNEPISEDREYCRKCCDRVPVKIRPVAPNCPCKRRHNNKY